jgi:hypothetical protein
LLPGKKVKGGRRHGRRRILRTPTCRARTTKYEFGAGRGSRLPASTKTEPLSETLQCGRRVRQLGRNEEQLFAFVLPR